MNSINIQLNTVNAAFDGENRNTETARILRQFADRIEGGNTTDCRLKDINGNTCGTFLAFED